MVILNLLNCPICDLPLTVGYNEFCENCVNGNFNVTKRLYIYQLINKDNSINLKFYLMKKLINTKDLILNTIKDKLENDNIEKLLLVFNLHKDIYSSHIKLIDSNKTIKFNMDKKDTSMIKKMFVSKIRNKIENVENFKEIIITVELEKNDFGIFLSDNENVVTKLEF